MTEIWDPSRWRVHGVRTHGFGGVCMARALLRLLVLTAVILGSHGKNNACGVRLLGNYSGMLTQHMTLHIPLAGIVTAAGSGMMNITWAIRPITGMRRASILTRHLPNPHHKLIPLLWLSDESA